ncbi:transcription factor TFIIIB component B'' [Fistulifera solaris]|uniref:Transcription factor TFIIIB component B n=1 Tax=Fistulifera solaris TaxID=1519565 RepID=A0A1Z5J7T1_FISSO|nr:transcription factor TFIIIB component B'' [Fistulifera solaris]|eukprot:GAX09878.1 transcription factor TFIIIB component B'' [Fistulifera solaris]
MSDEVALTPLHHVIQMGKKRKRNFRPTRLKNAKAVHKQRTNSDVSHAVEKEGEERQQRIEEEEEEEEFSADLNPEDEQEMMPVASEPPPKAIRPRTRPKKYKKIAVSVGSVRPPTLTTTATTTTVETSSETVIEEPLPTPATTRVFVVEDTKAMDEMDEAILAKDPGDLPRLTTFCSQFKVKRKKGAAKETTAPHREHRETRDETTTAGPVVQIVNGEIVLQESSVVINRANRGDEDASVVEEEAQLAVVGATAHSFTNRNKSQRWTADQTRLFYQALRQVGTDFGTMEAFFQEKRTRKQLKRKYQAELIRNPRLIEKALDPSTRADLDLSVFQLTEEEKKRIYEPLVTVDQNTKDPPESDENESDTLLLNPKAPSDPRAKDEEEVLEEDALEEQRLAAVTPAEPFVEPEIIIDDAPFEEEENNDTAVVSLIPAVTTTVKSKKKPSFRSLRTKKKK